MQTKLTSFALASLLAVAALAQNAPAADGQKPNIVFILMDNLGCGETALTGEACSMEGSLRAPCIIRWPGRIAAGRVSNEIMHEVDTYTTFATLAGASVPHDRAIDGVDQTDFLLGTSNMSNRAGFPVFVADRLEAVK